jgi:hypothetical protein
VTEPRDEDRRDNPREDEVIPLLAAAGAERPPTPPEVSDRLDDELARLVAERAGSPARADHLGGPVLPTGVVGGEQPARLGGRRRRWSQVLVAAAAVSVVGLGVTTVLDGRTGDGDAATSTEAGGAGAGEADSAPQTDAQGEGTFRMSGVAPLVRSTAVRTDVQRIEDLALARPAGATPLNDTCVTPPIGEGDEWTRVRYDGDPAVLVLRAPADGRRSADVFRCRGTLEQVASTTVDAR